jgi:hypothetical protein
LRGTQYQLVSEDAVIIADGDPVVFNDEIETEGDITYAAGEFTLNHTGLYFVTWWVDTDSAEDALEVSFGVSLFGGAPIVGTSPVISGQLNGSALVNVLIAPAPLQLVNASGVSVTLSQTPSDTNVRANIVIMDVSV